MIMKLLDPLDEPSGRELVTQRPAWRVRLSDERVLWAFVEERDGQLWVTGYPSHRVERAQPARNPAAGAVVGLGAGALIGGALGGPGGAIIGGLIGAVLVGSGTNSGRR